MGSFPVANPIKLFSLRFLFIFAVKLAYLLHILKNTLIIKLAKRMSFIGSATGQGKIFQGQKKLIFAFKQNIPICPAKGAPQLSLFHKNAKHLNIKPK